MENGSVCMAGEAKTVMQSAAIKKVFDVKPVIYEIDGISHCTVRPVQQESKD